MEKNNRRSKRGRRRKNSKRSPLVIILLFIILSTAFLIRNKLALFSTNAAAKEMSEEDRGIINENIDYDDKDDGTSETDSNDVKDDIKNLKKEPIDNPEDILIIVNKQRYLNSDYKPNDLIIPNVKFSFDGEHEKKYMRHEAAIALEELFNQASREGVYLYAVSGYRSYYTQERIFKNKANKVGEEEANRLVAKPGESEHQTGLAMDVSSQSVQFTLSENFGDSAEGKWLKDNAHRFGFIIRYPKDKIDITGYSYEPWHIRYVGKNIAKKIYNEGIALEEYF